MPDRIETHADIAAPVERVWRALTDFREFGAWFGVALDGPFRVGEAATGRITAPGYDHLRWSSTTTVMEPPHRFAFTWRPYAIDPTHDYSAETPTTVAFTLEPHGAGTRLTVTETGFDALPAHRRDEAFRMNTRGWEMQMGRVRAHAEG